MVMPTQRPAKDNPEWTTDEPALVDVTGARKHTKNPGNRPSAGAMTSPVETSRLHVAVRVPAVPDPHPSAGPRLAYKGEGSAASGNDLAASWMPASGGRFSQRSS